MSRDRQEIADDMAGCLVDLFSVNLHDVKIIADAHTIPRIEAMAYLLNDADYARAEELLGLLKEYGKRVQEGKE